MDTMTDVIITVFQIYNNIDPLFLSFLSLITYLSRSVSSWSMFLCSQDHLLMHI